MKLIMTPTVQDALEYSRQQANEETEQLAVEIVNTASSLTHAELIHVLTDLVTIARRAGALDQICAEHKVADAVMARDL